MKKLLLLLAFALICISAKAQTITWEKINLPYKTCVYDMVVNNKGDIFIVAKSENSHADTAVILRSTDNATTWHEVSRIWNSSVISMTINNRQEVFLSNGGLWKSDSTGTIWNKFVVGGIDNLSYSKIKCLGSDSLLVLGVTLGEGGNNDILLKTPDLGLSVDTLYYEPHCAMTITTGVEFYPPNDIFIAITDFPMMGMCGGVFRTQNDGLSWTEIGLSDQQISGVTMTEQGNLFISSWQSLTPNTSTSGVFILYSGTDTFVQCFDYAFITDVAVNSSSYIFASFNTYHGTFPIYLSTDNGSTFAPCSDEMDGIFRLYCDKFDYVYAFPERSENFIYRTASPTTNNDEKMLNACKPNVYPNPFNDKISIKINEVNPQNIEIQLINSLGQIVYSKNHEVTDNEIIVNTQSLPAGIYICRVLSNNKPISSNKIIKTK